MLETQLSLSEQIQNALGEISQRTGKSVNELIYEAIEIFVSENQQKKRRDLMHKARGIWADREYLNSRDIRQEWDRF
ncbi:CopG family transcriptional regulator [Scytonema sp. UIC 10036]|uniref:CopG family transcriptional regulator n=1 Tax=Scytonema sp. UIC 10036 TaxID=2304196 RepID=UPI0012DA831C|nr:CopG family transcriptional regulator [Scytonema sp. UIC 10036]MUG93055.1 CopG family transcriptional regulator [Scytonema sp. UIC 10036]